MRWKMCQAKMQVFPGIKHFVYKHKVRVTRDTAKVHFKYFVERGKNAWTHWRAVGLKGGSYERRATDRARCSSYAFYSSEIG